MKLATAFEILRFANETLELLVRIGRLFESDNDDACERELQEALRIRRERAAGNSGWQASKTVGAGKGPQ